MCIKRDSGVTLVPKRKSISEDDSTTGCDHEWIRIV